MKVLSSEKGIVYFFYRQLYYALHSQLGQVQKFYCTNIFLVTRKVFYQNIYLLYLSTVTSMTFQLDVEGTATPLSTW